MHTDGLIDMSTDCSCIFARQDAAGPKELLLDDARVYRGILILQIPPKRRDHRKMSLH